MSNCKESEQHVTSKHFQEQKKYIIEYERDRNRRRAKTTYCKR